MLAILSKKLSWFCFLKYKQFFKLNHKYFDQHNAFTGEIKNESKNCPLPQILLGPAGSKSWCTHLVLSSVKSFVTTIQNTLFSSDHRFSVVKMTTILYFCIELGVCLWLLSCKDWFISQLLASWHRQLSWCLSGFTMASSTPGTPATKHPQIINDPPPYFTVGIRCFSLHAVSIY